MEGETHHVRLTETSARTLDPFAWFGDRPGTYEVVAYDGESLAAALTTDVNGDGQIVSPANPVTPYLIANADQLAERTRRPPFRFGVRRRRGDGNHRPGEAKGSRGSKGVMLYLLP